MANKQEKNIMELPVDVVCYGSRQHYSTRKEAAAEYRQAMLFCEGSERERYSKIYLELTSTDLAIVSDGDPEIKKSDEVGHYTLADKDKILQMIEADELSINRPKLYDRGKCELYVEDRDVIKALLKQDGSYAAQFLRKYIENDKELLMAVSLGGEEPGRGLAYASADLQDDKGFVLEMLKIDASDFQYVSDRLSDDIEVVSVALAHAKDDYDVSSIKEGMGTKLFTELVLERQAKNREVQGIDNIIEEAESLKDPGKNRDGKPVVRGDR